MRMDQGGGEDLVADGDARFGSIAIGAMIDARGTYPRSHPSQSIMDSSWETPPQFTQPAGCSSSCCATSSRPCSWGG